MRDDILGPLWFALNRSAVAKTTDAATRASVADYSKKKLSMVGAQGLEPWTR